MNKKITNTALYYDSYRIDSSVSVIILTQTISSSLEIELAMRNHGPDHGFDDDVPSDTRKLNRSLNVSSLIAGWQQFCACESRLLGDVIESSMKVSCGKC